MRKILTPFPELRVKEVFDEQRKVLDSVRMNVGDGVKSLVLANKANPEGSTSKALVVESHVPRPPIVNARKKKKTCR